MRHAMQARQDSSPRAEIAAQQVAVDPWRVIQYLEQRRAEKRKRVASPIDDLDPKLIDLFARLKSRVRPQN